MYRELLYFLAWRDVRVRYKQTLVGVAWVVLRPLLTMLVLTFVFHRVAGLESAGDTPYALMVFAGLLPWQFFATVLSESGNSLVVNAQMVSKVYFPRVIVPASTVLAGLVDLFVMMLLLLPLMLFYGHWPGIELLALPLFIGLGIFIVLATGIGLAALNVRYRDVRFVLPFIVQFGLYLSPVGFSAAAVPSEWRFLYDLNPMVAVIEGCRWSLLGGQYPISTTALISCIVTGVILFVISMRYFRKTERYFADVI
jgi:lipopolysaccharide transport system permease protein